MKRTESMRVMNNLSSENGIPKLHLGLNERLIDSCVVFCRLPGATEESYYQITFGRRQERHCNLAAKH